METRLKAVLLSMTMSKFSLKAAKILSILPFYHSSMLAFMAKKANNFETSWVKLTLIIFKIVLLYSVYLSKYTFSVL